MSLIRRNRLISACLSAVLTLTLLAGCSTNSNSTATSTADQTQSESALTQSEPLAIPDASTEEIISTEITVVDQAGRTVTLDAPAQTIVSSYYISTALLMALDQTEKLVGIEMLAETRGLYLAAAPELLDLPAVGSGKGINVEQTAELAPDVVILPLKLQDSVASFEALGIPVILVNPETQADFESCVTLLATVCGADERGAQLLAYYSEQMQLALDLTADLTEKSSVYLSAGSDYLSTCTSLMYQNDLIAMAGGINVSADLTDSYWATISAEQLLLWQPDYIFAVSYATYTLDDIKNDSTLSALSAVQNDEIYLFPSALEPWDYPTPSSVLGVLYLLQALHPDLYTQAQYLATAQDFYQEFFDITVTEADLGL